MNKQRKFVLIAAAVGLIACFLPWFSVSAEFLGIKRSSSANALDDWRGIFAFIAFIAAGIVAFMGDQTKSMAQTFWFIALASGALAVLGVLLYFLAVSKSTGASEYGKAGYGFGIFIAAIAAAGVLWSAYMYRSPGDTIKGGFDSLKGDIEKKVDKPA